MEHWRVIMTEACCLTRLLLNRAPWASASCFEGWRANKQHRRTLECWRSGSSAVLRGLTLAGEQAVSLQLCLAQHDRAAASAPKLTLQIWRTPCTCVSYLRVEENWPKRARLFPLAPLVLKPGERRVSSMEPWTVSRRMLNFRDAEQRHGCANEKRRHRQVLSAKKSRTNSRFTTCFSVFFIWHYQFVNHELFAYLKRYMVIGGL